MAYDPTEFDRLMGSAFSIGEQTEFTMRILSSIGIQTVNPGREELLGRFDGLLANVTGLEEGVASTHIDRFLDEVSGEVDIAPGNPIKIKKAGGFMVAKASGGVSWAMITPDTDLDGDFAGIIVGPWYDVPHGLKIRDLTPYERSHGLLVAINNPRIMCDDRPVATLEEPVSLVALNYCEPELYKLV